MSIKGFLWGFIVNLFFKEYLQEVSLHGGVLECPGEVQGEEATG